MYQFQTSNRGKLPNVARRRIMCPCIICEAGINASEEPGFKVSEVLTEDI